MYTTVRALACVALFCAGSVGVAEAQGMPQDDRDLGPPLLWEVTPFAAYRMGGSFDLTGMNGSVGIEDHGSFGLAIDLSLDGFAQYELLYTRQETRIEQNSPIAPFDLNVEYLHLGGTVLVSDELPILPYISGGLGITRFSPQNTQGSDDTRFSISLGGGLKLPVTDRLAVRLEGRGYLTFVDNQSSVFCASGSQGGICAIRVRSDTLFQFELMAGAAFAF